MDMASDDMNAPPAAPARAPADLRGDAARAAQGRAEFNANDFVALVSHDLRLPLRTIAGLAMRIRDGADADETGVLRAWAEDLLASTGDLDRLIGDLADDTLDGNGTLRMSSAPIDVSSLVSHVADVFGPLATAKTLVLSRDINGPLPVTGDRKRLLQVLCNLVDNAIQFTPVGGRVRIKAGRQGGECVIAVIDTGAGIPKQALQSVFSSRRAAGSDERPTWRLGLYCSRGIVEAHDGRLWAEGESGAGSTFYLTLPLDRSDAPD
jgi:two-component system, OmpR family, sensor histidine kinase ResE